MHPASEIPEGGGVGASLIRPYAHTLIPPPFPSLHDRSVYISKNVYVVCSTLHRYSSPPPWFLFVAAILFRKFTYIRRIIDNVYVVTSLSHRTDD